MSERITTTQEPPSILAFWKKLWIVHTKLPSDQTMHTRYDGFTNAQQKQQGNTLVGKKFNLLPYITSSQTVVPKACFSSHEVFFYCNYYYVLYYLKSKIKKIAELHKNTA